MNWFAAPVGRLVHAWRRGGHPLLLACLAALSAHQCAYPHHAGPLHPGSTQGSEVNVADDGTVTYARGRFEVSVRPMTDEELNRQFAPASGTTDPSANPYAFAAARPGPDGKQPQRFTVFRVGIKNYAFPKVRIDPARIVVRTGNGREYWSLGFGQLDTYLRPYAIGYRGNAYHHYQELVDLLARTLLRNAEVFSGQETSGYVVFPVLHPDVTELQVEILDAVLRFDYRNEPVETASMTFAFAREVGRLTAAQVRSAR